jgi:hypothetical protein
MSPAIPPATERRRKIRRFPTNTVVVVSLPTVAPWNHVTLDIVPPRMFAHLTITRSFFVDLRPSAALHPGLLRLPPVRVLHCGYVSGRLLPFMRAKTKRGSG